MVNLTKSDWVEIYYAVEAKSRNVPGPLPLSGEWTPAERKAQEAQDAKDTRAWEAQLKRILKKIGPDGENMWRRQ